jgi:predicted acylesterase/phospholipase RssA
VIAANGLLVDPDEEPKCRVAVVDVMKRGANKLPALLRTYWTTVPPDTCTIVDAARATSAATTFFPPATFQTMYGVPVTYVDGGLRNNHPIRLAVHEAEVIWPNCNIGCIVSIGTGISELVNFEGNKLVLAQKLLDISKDCQAVDEEMEQRFGGMQRKMYFLFDPPRDLARIGLG